MKGLSSLLLWKCPSPDEGTGFTSTVKMSQSRWRGWLHFYCENVPVPMKGASSTSTVKMSQSRWRGWLHFYCENVPVPMKGASSTSTVKMSQSRWRGWLHFYCENVPVQMKGLASLLLWKCPSPSPHCCTAEWVIARADFFAGKYLFLWAESRTLWSAVCRMWISNHLKLWVAVARHNFKWVKIRLSVVRDTMSTYVLCVLYASSYAWYVLFMFNLKPNIWKSRVSTSLTRTDSILLGDSMTER